MGKLSNVIPEVINSYNVYKDGNKLIGVSGEVELPELEALTDTIEGAGILGEIDDPVTGQFSAMTIKIPFAVLYEDLFSLMNTTEPPQLTLRGSMQCMDPKTGATGYYPVRIVIRGKAATTSLGKFAKGKKGEAEIELQVLYIKIEVNNTEVLELDKLNFKFKLNGKDMLAKVRKQI
jgi:P2 family phage contractile tail tube protein